MLVPQTSKVINTKVSKSSEVSHLQGQFEGEIDDLRRQIANLENKNKKYLEVICSTVADEDRIRMQLDSAQDAVTLTKQSKEANIDIAEIESMMTVAQQELTNRQEQIKFLNDELQ